jgi:Tfp pilus assembly protein PilF
MISALIGLLLAPALASSDRYPSFTKACTNYMACYNSANEPANRGDCLYAIELYSGALMFDPRNPWAFSSRATLKLALGDKEGAEKDFQQALENKHLVRGFRFLKIQTPAEKYGRRWRCMDKRK